MNNLMKIKERCKFRIIRDFSNQLTSDNVIFTNSRVSLFTNDENVTKFSVGIYYAAQITNT